MSLITSITVQEKNKKRCNIFIDGDFFIGLPIELVYKLSLKVGMNVDEEELKSIAVEKDKTEAFEKSLNYISKTIKTKKQLITYLYNKGYGEQVVFYCVDRLKELGLLNDQEFARRYIESTSSSQGKNLIAYKLMMKGVRKEEIESAYCEVEVNSKEIAKSLVEKKLFGKEITRETLSKTYKYLISKGFSYDDANYAISTFKEDC